MEGQIRVILRHMEGQETTELDPHQGKLQKYLSFEHILMYTGLGVISAYIRGKGIKIRVQQTMSIFRDDSGNIKGTKIVHGVQRVCRETGKDMKSVINHVW